MRVRTLALALAAVALVATGCAKTEAPAPGAPAAPAGDVTGKVSAAGSTALLPLIQQAAEEFMDRNPKLTVNVSGGGAFTGLTQVTAGSIDIGNFDMELPQEYKDKGLKQFPAAVAPFLMIVHPGVTVENLTQQQATDIFTGKITNWKDVGGADQPITIIHRAPSSGSRAVFKNVVMKGAEFTDKATIQDSNGSVRTAIAGAPGAIGYIDAAYLDKSVKALKYNGTEYSLDNVINGQYPVYSMTYMLTRGEPQGAVKAFIDYVASTDFQERIATKMGFVPITKMKK